MKKSSILLLLTATLSLLPGNYLQSEIPTAKSISQAISSNRLVSYGLAGAGIVATAATLVKTDLGATKITDPKLYWDWNTIDTTDISFPKDFIFGAATSAYQVEGNCINTDWWQWERQYDSQGKRRVEDLSGRACDQWHKYKEDVELMHKMGIGIYRFSIAWDKVQPSANSFDQEAIEHYKDICRELNKYNIQAHIGFHHYTDPLWFAELGGFAKEENIDYFADYCARMVAEFKDVPNVKLWSTFNSPSGFAMKKYVTGDFYPGVKGDQKTAFLTLKNMLEAHVRAYDRCKKANPDAQIGILKNIMQFDPWRPWNPIDNFVANMVKRMTDDSIFGFFTTGRFVVKMPFEGKPFMVNMVYENPQAPYALDFIGLNYYGHSYMKNTSRFLHPDEIKTQNPNYALYPEGLYRAIRTISQEMVQPIEAKTGRHLPIYVTENGIASNDPEERYIFFTRYLYALSKAIQDGFDVRGYTFWSFMDNYEWGSYAKKYGLVHVDFDSPALTRTLKSDKGTSYYLNLIKPFGPNQ